MGPPVHPELFELAFRIHEPAGGVVDVGAKLCCIQLPLSSAQYAQPMLYLLLLGQGLSVPGGVELVSEPWPASVSAFLAPLGSGGFPFPPDIGSLKLATASL
jgi:hypothetical protein